MTDTKAQLAKVLRKKNKRIIVLIDDIDRLIPEEVLETT